VSRAFYFSLVVEKGAESEFRQITRRRLCIRIATTNERQQSTLSRLS